MPILKKLFFLFMVILLGAGSYYVYTHFKSSSLSNEVKKESSINMDEVGKETEQMRNGESAGVISDCKVTGCNSEICTETDKEDVASTCIFKPEYECYKQTKCEKQPDGKCGWTESDSFKKCLEESESKSIFPTDLPQ